MEIYVRGELLDVPANSGIDISYQNIRFGGSVLPDAVTTDIDIPLNKKNRRLLDIKFEFFFGKANRVPCVVYTNGGRYVGYIVVNSAKEYTASITLYLSMSFAGLSDVPLRNLIEDDASTIYRWYESQAGNGTSIWPKYAVEKQSTKGCYGRHPVADHLVISSAISSRIGAPIDESDWQIPQDDNYWDINDIAVVATGKYVTPTNPTQCIVCLCAGGESVFGIFGGQHIVNDLVADEQPFWNGSKWYPSSFASQMVFNRDCTATIQCEKHTVWYDYNVYAYVNGTELSWFTNASGYAERLDITTVTYNFKAGDVLQFKVNGGDLITDKVLMLRFDFSNYGITNDDYDNDLNYQPVSVEWTDWVNTTKPYDHSDWSFSYFGLWNNMPEKSVKDYLTTICWMSDMRYVRTDNPLSLKMVSLGGGGRTLEREQVDDVVFSSDKLGKVNFIRYKDEAIPSAVIYANGDGLEDEKVLFESEFRTPSSPRDLLMRKHVCVPIYEVDFEEEGVDSENWSVKYEDLEGVIAMICHDEDYIWAYLTMPPLLKTMNLSDFDSVVEIEGWTRQQIAAEESFVIDGERFAVVTVDYNDDNETYHYTALRISDKVEQPMPPAETYIMLGVEVGGEYYLIGKEENSEYNIIGQ